LDNRKNLLENYLSQLLSLKRIPPRVLEFIEFHNATNTNQRISTIDDILHKTTVRIPASEIIIDEKQKARTYYQIELNSKETGQCLYLLKK
jgi:hypothetical protein